jgi:hypothetical protein
MTINSPDIEAIIQQLYERDGLTDSLMDDDAKMMLEWAEKGITQLAQQEVALPQLEDFARQIQQVVQSCNRLVGGKADLSDTEMLEQLLGLVEKSIQLAQLQSTNLSGKETGES